MSIVTKAGDKGMTSLCFGRRIYKDDPRIDICGNLDELCSYIGLSKSIIKDKKAGRLLQSIQEEIFVIGAEVARGKKSTRKISPAHVRNIEKYIDELERKKVLKKRCFYLPGQDFTAAVLDVARTVARRVERSAVALKRKKMLRNALILVYLNRLSDLLYLMARCYEKNSKVILR
ncbi:MAG: cob(I)yrinic acid a,c-diamide adenosyltransferase [Candidatus Omnitrophica bacterium]|nr:cob(I)yrinic acid a,c-diamide adenosyltransferase [Candidatus Omnitrophota bacterium]